MSKPLKLETLQNGAVLEAFEVELQNVLDNIQDPNTKPDGVREVSVRLKFKPSKDRNYTSLTYSVASKLQPSEPGEVPIFVDRDRKNKRATAVELVSPDENPDQERLPGLDEKVTPINQQQAQ
ncbi:hypothetical protein [Solidesulfovibrio sp.]